MDKHMWATEKVSTGGLPARQPAETWAAGGATSVCISKSHKKEKKGRRRKK